MRGRPRRVRWARSERLYCGHKRRDRSAGAEKDRVGKTASAGAEECVFQLFFLRDNYRRIYVDCTALWSVLTFALGDLPAPGPAPKELNAHHNSTSSPSDSSRVRQMKMTKRVSTKGSSSGAAVYW